MRLIDADALYERACNLEAQALDYVGKLIERDDDEPSNEWRVWSAILTERTAFKHDVFDAPTVQPEQKKGKWILDEDPHDGDCRCSACHIAIDQMHERNHGLLNALTGGKWWTFYKYCPICGADMRCGDTE